MGQVLVTKPADLVVVDLNLGDEDGLEFVRKLSVQSDVPIIVISGDRLGEADRVVGPELGATDYVRQPFGMREFLARVRAALRQRPMRVQTSLSFNKWTLHVKQRRLVDREDTEIKLTAGEFNLLAAFLSPPSNPHARATRGEPRIR